MVLRIPLNCIKVLHLYVRDQKKHKEFIMCALDMRQKILFADTLNESKDTLVYETEHIQKLFVCTVETGLQDNLPVRV